MQKGPPAKEAPFGASKDGFPASDVVYSRQQIWAYGGSDMGFWGDLFKSSFEKWVEEASVEELSEAYEKERKEWIKGGGGDKTSKMNRLNKEISKRVAEKWENDPRRNKDPNFRWTDEARWDDD